MTASAAGAEDPPEIAPIRRGPLYEEVVARLRGWIADRGLAPGDRLPSERDLAQQLAVSRTSVRQALTAMRVMGLVEVQHGNGAYLARRVDDVIPPIAAEVARRHPEFAAIGEVRNALEELAAELACARRSDDDLRRMASALDGMAAEIAAGGTGISGDRAFHAAVVEAARNAMLREVLRGLDDCVRRIAEASLSRRGQPPRSLATHREIVTAIERRDVEEAARLMRDHLEITGELAS